MNNDLKYVDFAAQVMVMFDGVSVFEFTDTKVALGLERSIVNRTIVITEREDDLGSGTGTFAAESRRTGE